MMPSSGGRAMSLLIVLFNLMVWSCGLVNLFILAMLFRRDRDPLYRQEFLLMSAFMLILVLESLPLLVPAADQGAQYEFIRGIVADVGVSLLVYALPAYINLITQIAIRKIMDWAFGALAAVGLAAGIVGRWFFNFGGWIPFGAAMVAIAFTTGLAVVMTVADIRKKARIHQENNETLELARRMGIFALALMPFLVYFDFLEMPLPLTGWQLPKGINVTPVILLVWSLLLLRLRCISALTTPSEDANLSSLAGRAFHDHYGISPREQEVLALLVTGLSYESMADRLCISLSTVKTHINRIYRKTGVNSKVELIHCLQHHNQPESRQPV
jgi:DNA-binding CsgD family transcriptional regulator